MLWSDAPAAGHLQGQGELSGVGISRVPGVMHTYAQDSSMSIQATVARVGRAAPRGTATLSADGRRRQYAAASLNGTGGALATGTRGAAGEAILAGSGSTQASAWLHKFFGIDLVGTSELPPVGTSTILAQALLAGSSAMVVVPTVRVFSQAAALLGTATIGATGLRRAVASIALSGGATLVETAFVRVLGKPNLQTEGGFAITPTVNPDSGALDFVGTGSLGAVAAGHYLNATSTLTVAGQVTHFGAMGVSAQGSMLSTAAAITTRGVVTMPGEGSFTSTGAPLPLGVVTLVGQLDLQAQGQRVTYGVVGLQGDLQLAALGESFIVGQAALVGDSSVVLNVGRILTLLQLGRARRDPQLAYEAARIERFFPHDARVSPVMEPSDAHEHGHFQEAQP